MQITNAELCNKAKWLVAPLAMLIVAMDISGASFAEDVSVPHKTKNIVLVMLDGLRPNEVFKGADPKLINKRGPRMLGASEQRTSQAKDLYWRDTPKERREVLMPFMWGVVAKKGQIFGNRQLGSDSHVKNHMKFSYPGYNETLTGAPDDRRIQSNRDIPNPNMTVLEWLNRKQSYNGTVAAFGAWQRFEAIFNIKRCGFVVNAGYKPLDDISLTPELALLNKLKTHSPRVWEDEAFDVLPFYTAMEYLRSQKPRVMFIGLGETDDWAHMGSYPEYLNAAHRDDEYLEELWTLLQSMPEYRDQTTLVVLSDHGRGSGPLWKLHALGIPGAGQTWMAFLGPDTLALGEREVTSPVTESQTAATLAALIGEDYNGEVTKSSTPIIDVLGQQMQKTAHAVPSESQQQK
jgi:hypothetical protein